MGVAQIVFLPGGKMVTCGKEKFLLDFISVMLRKIAVNGTDICVFCIVPSSSVLGFSIGKLLEIETFHLRLFFDASFH